MEQDVAEAIPISGQVTGEMAKGLSERFGKILQTRESAYVNIEDTSISRNKQLKASIPATKIAFLSAGEFVGMVADNPDEIKLKGRTSFRIFA